MEGDSKDTHRNTQNAALYVPLFLKEKIEKSEMTVQKS